MKRAFIWCEVVCSQCNRAIGADYINSKTIARIKKQTKDWRFDVERRNICPDCLKLLSEGKKTPCQKCY